MSWLCHLLCHRLQITYLNYLLLSIDITVEASLPLLWKLNQVGVEISSNNAIQLLLIIPWSLFVRCDFCTEVVRCFMSHVIWEKPQEVPNFNSVCIYIFIFKQDSGPEYWDEMLKWYCFGMVWHEYHPLIFMPYTSADFERRHAGKLISMKWMAVIFSEKNILTDFSLQKVWFLTYNLREHGITKKSWPFREESKARGRKGESSSN